MKKIEFVYREILHQALERQNKTLTQLELSKKLGISLSTVNYSLKPLRAMGAIEVRLKNFKIIDAEKILYYWASIRSIEKDIVYKTRVDSPVSKIESEVPSDAIFGAYSSYKHRFKDVPADYSEVYIYSDEIQEIKKRFGKNEKRANLFVLKKDKFMEIYSRNTCIAQLFADLWNLKEWYAKEFLISLKEKIKEMI